MCALTIFFWQNRENPEPMSAVSVFHTRRRIDERAVEKEEDCINEDRSVQFAVFLVYQNVFMA